jgi:enamine deaminase RidA (YjgF/YER057c/UK114 family)
MRKDVVHTDKAAVTGAPLVQAVKLGNLVFCSGASPRDPRQGNRVVEGGFTAQISRRCWKRRAADSGTASKPPATS